VEVGLVLAVPGFVGSALEPLLGVAGDTAHRRGLLLVGGVLFALSAALTAVAWNPWSLLVALAVGNPASTAFVSFAQASLMDLEPAARGRNMARWTLAGSLGIVAGPIVLTLAVALGGGWRAISIVLALLALGLTVAAARTPLPVVERRESFRDALEQAARALRRREVLRWIALLEASDLMLDVFHAFLALYLVDVAGAGPVEVGLALGVWTGAGLVGDALLLVVLQRVDGVRYLRASAFAVTGVFPLLLLVSGTGAGLPLLALLGLLNAGWYAIPKAGLYDVLPGRSGTAIAVGSVGGLAGAAVPLLLGLAAERVGLGATMWLLLLAPVALLVGLPRSKS